MALYYRKRLDNKQEIAVWEITESEEELIEIVNQEGHKAEVFNGAANLRRRLEQLAVRALLDRLFTPQTRLHYQENGRPFLENRTHSLGNKMPAISIAHTRRFAVVLTGPGEKAGIDVECFLRDFTPVEKKALHPSESLFLSPHPQERGQQLALIWCAKEAMFKYMSREEVDFSKQMCVAPFVPKDNGTLQGSFQTREGTETFLPLSYRKLEDHFMVWVCG